MKAVIIRFEDSTAICRKEDKSIFKLKKGLLPPDTKEGDILEIFGSSITKNFSEMRKRKNRIDELLKDILA